MPIDPAEVFKVMQCAYRNGVLDKFMVIQGEALEAVMAEANVNMGDLLNRMDEAGEETVMRIDRLLDRAGPLMKYLDNDRLMKVASRLLDLVPVKKMMVANMKNSILKTLSDSPPPSLADKLRALVGKAA
ncbi:MAG: hypothetical protein C4536_04035 [Actinobacteria bacterium]|nr:MAG: hypothetical protein C4536_04035 [Actinomycetota bacterium]